MVIIPMTRGVWVSQVWVSKWDPLSISRPFGEGMGWVYSYREGKYIELITSRYFTTHPRRFAAVKTSVLVWHGKTCDQKRETVF